MNKINLEDKILVAGASGMAGSAIVRALFKNGYGNPIYNGKIYTPTRKELNLLNYEKVEEWLKIHKPDVVIIAAAKVGGILANDNYSADFLLENLKIEINLIESSFKNNVRRLLFLGSSCIYPKACNQPIKEEYLLNGGLESTNEAYAIAKITGIKLCESLRKQYDFDAISLMPTNLYGPGDNYHPTNSHVLPSLIRKFSEANKDNTTVTCWGTGSPLREFMHVDDLGDACVFALEKWDIESINAPKDSRGEPLSFLNVGTGKDISIKELALMIAAEIKFKGEIFWDITKPDGTKRKLLDVNKISELGWESKIDLKEGLRKTLDSYKKEIITKNLRI